MRLLTFISLILFGLGGTDKIAAIKDNPINGTWIPISQEFAGTVLPKPAFETQKLIISDSTYVFSAESVDKGTLAYKDGKMDIYGKDGVNTGKHFSAIYKYENDQLTICYNLAGNGYPESYDTKGRPLFFLSVYQRELVK